MWSVIPILRTLSQGSNEVVVRKPGQRFLGAPLPISSFAKEHWEFAWLSDAAYLQTDAGQKHIQKTMKNKRCLTSVQSFPNPLRPWPRWVEAVGEFSRRGVAEEDKGLSSSRPSMERDEPPAVAVTFGGTVF